jgi:hypothetical protein
MTLGRVDGEAVVIVLRDGADGLTPFSVIRVIVADDRISRITDYIKCPWVLEAAASVDIAETQRDPRSTEVRSTQKPGLRVSRVARAT